MLNKLLFSIYISIIFPFITLGVDIPLKDDITSFESLLKIIIKAMLDLAVPVIVLAIVYVGFLFIKAQGNDSELTKAKQALTWVLVGTAVVIGSNALYNIFYAAI